MPLIPRRIVGAAGWAKAERKGWGLVRREEGGCRGHKGKGGEEGGGRREEGGEGARTTAVATRALRVEGRQERRERADR